MESHAADAELTTEKEYSALTYNIGFGAYTPDFSFFMDGGKFSWAKSKDSVLKTVQGAGELVASYDPDFALIEEVDLNSTRSYHVNEYSILKECLADYDTVFAQNYDCLLYTSRWAAFIGSRHFIWCIKFNAGKGMD